MSRRTLWHPLAIEIDLDDPALLVGVSERDVEFFAARVTFTPCRGGTIMRLGGRHPTRISSPITAHRMLTILRDESIGLAHDSGGMATATGRHHLDRAQKWSAVRSIVRDRARSIWPSSEPESPSSAGC